MPKVAPKSSLEGLVRGAVRGERRAISKLMSLAENDPELRIEILSLLYWRAGKAHIIGITGPPGCGKSTLIARLAESYSRSGSSVGIVAVDPSSQITGGALLGDRIRMADLASNPKVYIRSMATRGHFGGIARATEDAVRILDASGNDYVIVETAGAGQSDVDVKSLVHTTVVVTAPGLGDEIQALKAGIMEIGDIFVVNKADKENADRTAQEINSMVMMTEAPNGWRARVIKTTALTGVGVLALFEAIAQHASHVKGSSRPEQLDAQRLRHDVLEAAKTYFADVTIRKISSKRRFDKLMSQVLARKLDPYTAARLLVSKMHTD